MALAFIDLANDIDQEELIMAQQDNANDDEDGTEDDEDDDGWVDEVEELSKEEQEELKAHICPVSCVLMKACTLTEDVPSKQNHCSFENSLLHL